MHFLCCNVCFSNIDIHITSCGHIFCGEHANGICIICGAEKEVVRVENASSEVQSLLQPVSKQLEAVMGSVGFQMGNLIGVNRWLGGELSSLKKQLLSCWKENRLLKEKVESLERKIEQEKRRDTPGERRNWSWLDDSMNNQLTNPFIGSSSPFVRSGSPLVENISSVGGSPFVALSASLAPPVSAAPSVSGVSTPYPNVPISVVPIDPGLPADSTYRPFPAYQDSNTSRDTNSVAGSVSFTSASSANSSRKPLAEVTRKPENTMQKSLSTQTAKLVSKKPPKPAPKPVKPASQSVAKKQTTKQRVKQGNQQKKKECSINYILTPATNPASPPPNPRRRVCGDLVIKKYVPTPKK